ncbi:MAG: SsrA-binding protein, partial [Muribaculaceae bacterium]|nr:SsrA-binding protein [Muribaculaceae bacterium]
IEKLSADHGFTIVPIRGFISDRGYAKIVIGIGRGKKQYDKRQSIKERDDKRMLDRLMKK